MRSFFRRRVDPSDNGGVKYVFSSMVLKHITLINLPSRCYIMSSGFLFRRVPVSCQVGVTSAAFRSQSGAVTHLLQTS